MYSSTKNLVFLAGKKAFLKIREEGLKPEMIKVITGAAGGPKWLVLNHLDRVIFSSWIKNRKKPLFLLGSSIGAWRFAAASQNNHRQAIDRFQSEYLGQHYSSNPGPEEVTRETVRIMNRYIDDTKIREILQHPYMRLNIMAVRSKWVVSSDKKLFLTFGLLASAFLNAFSRNSLRFFFERALFYDERSLPPFWEMDGFPIKKIPLHTYNIKKALLASGSIPLIMSGVDNISHAPKGTYRDGGVIDYHMDIPFLGGDEGIVLYPHFTDRIIPGWFDKKLFWRKPLNMDHVLLIAPSEKFIDRLPRKKIPDRNDFIHFKGRDAERIECWKTVIKISERLGHEFLETVETGKIRKLIKPMRCVK
ncbi:MAG: patatin-like phospholipase family protein [Thermodesulfobacteriota bacterium]|nr:patatin-like phospholipase family protein [Thermodesulfobacteriota bacterium]